MNYTVIVAEDEELLLNNLVHKIEKADPDFQVIGTAQTGAQALSLVEQMSPDVIFTDIKMPVMDGITLLTRIRDQFPFTKFVITSGFSDFEYAKRAITLKVSDYLLKPVDPDELRNVLLKIKQELQIKRDDYETVFAPGASCMSPGQIAELLKNFMVQNYAEDINLNLIAGTMNYSPSYLTKIFCQVYDCTPTKYLINLRMSHAQKLLIHEPSLSVKQIGELISFVKKIKPEVICMVDNCYGEFVETIEPTDVGADMIVGSLIKNPGGGLAPIGGYIAGRKECVDRASYRLSAPGLGKEVGASLGLNQQLYQGFFLSPTVVAGALKGAIFAANVYERLGCGVVPNGSESRHDIIQAITFGTAQGVISFCKGIQAAAPVDSFVTPEPWDMPGYDSQVIMAAGAFVQGSSIELSADGPIKPPYAVYFQGGLTWYHAKLGILKSLQQLMDDGVLKILR